MKFLHKSAALLSLLATPLSAQEFKSPSGNIMCLFYSPGQHYSTYGLRCDIREHTASRPTPPPGCDLDWEGLFWLEEGAPGQRACAGDVGATDRAPVLDYGQQIRAGGISCRMERQGVTCTNAEGHGFFISRAEQRVF